jgi:hypothetical protein
MKGEMKALTPLKSIKLKCLDCVGTVKLEGLGNWCQRNQKKKLVEGKNYPKNGEFLIFPNNVSLNEVNNGT